MEFRITMEWDEECGISLKQMYPFRESIEDFFKNKEYGNSISQIWVMLNALGYDVKQRKRFKKKFNLLQYDVLLDYFLIKNVELAEKKKIIRNQLIEITDQAFSKYRFEDFDKAYFLKDLKEITYSINW